MANCCWNRWRLTGPDDALDEIGAALKREWDERSGSDITFATLAPMPAMLKRVRCGYATIAGKEHTRWMEEEISGKRVRRALNTAERGKLAQVRRRTGCDGAHEWATKFWGSTRDAHDTSTRRDPGTLLLEFVTAWNPPEPIARLIRKRWPTVRLTGTWEVDGGFGDGTI